MASVRAMTHGCRPALARVVCLQAGLYGHSDEIQQNFIPGRKAGYHDVAADISGGVKGTWLMYSVVAA